MTNSITFVHAPEIRYDQNYGTLFSPMWAYTLGAHLPESWDAEVVDLVCEPQATVRDSKIFAFSGINQDCESVCTARDRIKEKYPDATYIIGGPMTWSFEQEGKLDLLNGFDHIFVLDGEETLPKFLAQFEVNGSTGIEKIIRAERLSMEKSRPIRFDLFRAKAKNYYGAVVEVSRGCPFLCEFCDIRVLPGNNRANNKNPDIIIEEIDEYFKLGISQFQFACDNFIGDPAWARECVDAVLAWKERTGATISIFTWLTINLYKYPDLMTKMRKAGFSILFIGVESVNGNSLLETAKVQNCSSLEHAVREIQSYGFVIAPGFIFGFDSDTEAVFDETLEFICDTGLIGGDPSFLMALPGTPLYARMKRTNRLTNTDDEPTVREKITTNIRYLQDTDMLSEGFLDFIHRYTRGNYQFKRFQNHIQSITSSGNFIPVEGTGYASPKEYLRLQFKNSANRKMLFLRIGYLLRNPLALIAALRGRLLILRYAKTHPGLGLHFNYWVYVWTNIALKYLGLEKRDFRLHSVDADFDISTLLSGDSDIYF